MKSGSTKTPRASLSVTIRSDVEYIELCQSSAGREAFALFVALLIAAKDLNNGGEFAQSEAVIAALISWPKEAYRKALATLLAVPGEWVLKDAKAIRIRSFEKWNAGWGGSRDGAGRPQQRNQVGIQDSIQVGIQANQDGKQDRQLVSAPASVSVSKDIGAKKPRPDQLFAKSMLPLLASKAPNIEGELCKAFNTLKKSFSVANIETARDVAKRKAVSFADAGNVIGWFTNTIRNLGNGQTRPEPEYDLPAEAAHA